MSKRILEVELDPTELTLRIAEACLGLKRHPNTSAAGALALLASSQPDDIAGFGRAAIRAADYFVECINASDDWAETS